MKSLALSVLASGAIFAIALGGVGQSSDNTSTAASSASSSFTADYPANRPGVLIQGSDWIWIDGLAPFKIRQKHALASSLSYGAVAALLEADYQGVHASTLVAPGQPIICVCHLVSIPGPPIIVKLHSQKDSRELDGGRIPLIGGKMAEATKNDLVSTEVTKPEDTVWLVRPVDPLPEGEYALMLGAQNTFLYPFAVSASASTANGSSASNPANTSH